MSAINTKLNPAASFTQQQRKKERQAVYSAWRAGVSDTWLHRFVETGLRPFLLFFGYKLNVNDAHVVKCIRQWAYGHVLVQRYPSQGLEVRFSQGIHPADREAFEWYQSQISLEQWETLCDSWKTTEFLDSSDAGYAQRLDISNCMWYLVDLYGSKSHKKYLDTLPYEDYDEQHIVQHQDDSHAFTGDRRTH
jgi:hypothetical protein